MSDLHKVLLCVFGPVILMGIFMCFYENACVETRTIVAIGGCGKFDCGVQYDDGSFSTKEHPVVGMKVCTRRETQRRK